MAVVEQPEIGNVPSEESAGRAAMASGPSNANPRPRTVSKELPNELGSSASSTAHESTAGGPSRSSVGKSFDAAEAIAPAQTVSNAAGAKNDAANFLSSSLAARPVVAQHGNREAVGAAPVLGPAVGEPAQPAVLPGNIGSTSAPSPPMPRAISSAVVRAGGEIKPPALISSVLPAYPQLARDTGVEGNVVIDTVVGKDGSVTSEKVISGPVLLRQAALEALRTWKYQPPMLNGQPISMEIVVTIRFHR